jgi:hypothetical protein
MSEDHRGKVVSWAGVRPGVPGFPPGPGLIVGQSL